MSIQIDVTQEGHIGWLTFHSDEKVVTLSSTTLLTLKNHIRAIRANQTIAALVIESNLPDCFIAGANIHDIQAITTAEEGFKAAQDGQAILDELANLPIPTIAAIRGVALGGGLELALACHYRLVSDHPKTKLGLPEVNLGIIPGFGGTQRLPRLIGFAKALHLIPTAKLIDANTAVKMGVADKLLSHAFFKDEVRQFANQVVSRKRHKRRVNWEWSPWCWVMGWLAILKIRTKTKGNYPAPIVAVKAMISGRFKSLKSGQRKEAYYFSTLVGSPVSQRLIQLFFDQETAKKRGGAWRSPDVPALGVVGAGLMGGGIAWLAASNGWSVRLRDLKWNAIEMALQSARSIATQRRQSKKMSETAAQLALQRVSGSLTDSGFESIDVLIEAVVEDMGIKKAVFEQLEAVVPPHTLLATNTSALSVTEMASGLRHPERLVGIHFFSPVHRMPLVEVVVGEQTDDGIVEQAMGLVKSWGKLPICVKDRPGFLVNRLLIPYVTEAIRLVSEGIPCDTIDRIAIQFGMPVGPLALADEVGLDVGYKVAHILEVGLGSRMAVPVAFKTVMSQGWLGKKGGQGFYQYASNGAGKRVVNPALLSLFPPVKRLDHSIILNRLMGVMINEASRCLEEGVVESASMLDLAMVMGTGFPAFRGGICHYADSRGIQSVLQTLAELQSFGERFVASERLQEMGRTGNGFYTTERGLS